MKSLINTIIILIFLIALSECRSGKSSNLPEVRIRQHVDTVGFARYPWEMDTLMARIDRSGWERTTGVPWKMVICPLDDIAMGRTAIATACHWVGYAAVGFK